jgi:hypothetical protein
MEGKSLIAQLFREIPEEGTGHIRSAMSFPRTYLKLTMTTIPPHLRFCLLALACVASSFPLFAQQSIPPAPRLLPVAQGVPSYPRPPTASLASNYRITFSGKAADKALGELSILTCAPTLQLSGALDSSETPLNFSVSGSLEEKEGLMLFSYSIEITVPVTTVSQSGPNGMKTSTIQYQRQSSSGALLMKPGDQYVVLKSGGTSYSVVIAPEKDK